MCAKWCLMRASDMQDMGLWRRNHLCDENKSVRALFGQPPFPFQSCTRLRVFPSIRALAPFLGGSSDETMRFQRSSSPARVAGFTGMSPGLQFSLSLTSAPLPGWLSSYTPPVLSPLSPTSPIPLPYLPFLRPSPRLPLPPFGDAAHVLFHCPHLGPLSRA